MLGWLTKSDMLQIFGREVYGVYCHELKDEGSSVLSYKRFIALWEELYNQVWYYGSFWIKELFAYMGERMEYYKRIRMAMIFLINIS